MKLCQIPSLDIKSIIAQNIKISYSEESLNNLFLFSCLSYDSKLIFRFQKHCNPICNVSFHWHPKTSFNNTVFITRSCVNYMFPTVNQSFEIFNMEWFFTLLKNFLVRWFSTLLINFSIMEKVFRWSWKSLCNFLYKLVSICKEKTVIFLMLSS